MADELERRVDETGVDGFNQVPIIQPAGFRDFVELVVPELRRRVRLPPLTADTTLHEHYFGPGRPRLPANHVAQRTLPPWKA